MADTGKCDIALFGGPYIVVDTSTTDLGACDIALFGGPPIAYVTSTTQTQEESMSGGAVTGDSADKVAIRVEAGSTGAVSGGEAAKTATLIGEEVGVGGSVVGGTAGIVLTLALSASAGAVAGGSAEAVVVTVVAGSGGAVASSTLNPLALIAEVVADGGAEAGSSASLLVLRCTDCSGGSIAGYEGLYQFSVPSVSKTVPYSRGYWGINKASNPIWDFTEQKNKWGYLNNPRWTNEPSAPVNYDYNVEGEPQVWTTDPNKLGKRVYNNSVQHFPCGHWHKGPTEL